MDTPDGDIDLAVARDLRQAVAERWPPVEVIEREAARYPRPRWRRPRPVVVDVRAARRDALLSALRPRRAA